MEMSTRQFLRISTVLLSIIIILAMVVFALSRRQKGELRRTFSPKSGSGAMPAGESRKILEGF
ncbi:MAG TPA: hypothetical protein DET40_24835 [Lentisphaeria bacterium]|nr:MAG: hypothetical protein A2X45_01170 [Lentisphaerae bacterium GWF2_50_93]HCE46787.1 hypothetical protein [Lentisphaeria bacterium]